MVEDAEERRVSRPAPEGLEQFQIPQGRRIEDQGILLLVKADTVEVGKRAALRFADVVKDGAGGGHGEGMAFHSVTGQRRYAKMVAKESGAVLFVKNPPVEGSLG